MTFETMTAALFDLDGVVVFTDRYHYRAWKNLADRKGWEFDEEINEGCKGVPRMASLEVILKHNRVALPDAEKVALAEQKNTDYIASLAGIGEGDLVPGVREFLERLHGRGVRLALCSSSRNAKMVIDALALTPLFGAVVTGADISHPKPDPEIFLLGAKLLGLSSAASVVFEDAASGVAAAHAAGMRCVGVGLRENLPEADAWISHFDDPELPVLFPSIFPCLP